MMVWGIAPLLSVGIFEPAALNAPVRRTRTACGSTNVLGSRY